ncbi:30S ribosomal protein S11 [Aquifex aeolicus]|uniref:Small ribosomal subunit protein uS11 n=1 Tax=Aquifex aeolicus (strain VF5) TaxID=224324 RepID=RS11_AQUAE|nr:30S ribosomal protein S11 [Aquifex aeolicus]O66485.1 RecName: Full=Small ribosomal subunit protein uS11; AltName: Full=30S ribosomal protein S11 [Aquifex aeolicus VF5]AAC06444.1 ribosomal protein S11 [Aquifex aeolicus VF5]
MAKKKKKQKRQVTKAIVHIHTTFNNTIVNVTDTQGNTIAWASGGTVGFKGTRKSTPYAAQLAAQKAMKEAKEHGVQEVEIWVKGPGAGRESAVRAVFASGVKVTAIRDVTPIPHNGCRPPARRRV